MTPNIADIVAALKTPRPQGEVIRPGDTGDDMVVPPDPGYMAPSSPFMEVAAKSPMPFPDNHNPNMDFVNRWPAQLPSAGIMNDLKPKIETSPDLVRKLLQGPNG